ncbi:hypothetical protein NIIDNTM18_46450 [Mycolicibacterium litorale]|uniref:Uncharacterized protein n=2 Tax=Mycolicibacterium litorale TaxID=758802 RepID=A0A6S6PCL2_9MYCO|nr:hypothetical protein NIIDNTM18_46450 [Mycolicibacterium litorale]
MLCGGVLAVTVGMGSGAAQAAVPAPTAVSAAHVAAVDTGFAEYRPWFHPGHPFHGPRPHYGPWFAPRPYVFHGHYR